MKRLLCNRRLRVRRLYGPMAAAGLLLAVLVPPGCSRGSRDAAPVEPTTAREVLDRMVAAYQKAATYADSGRVRLRFEHGERKVDETLDFSVTLARPHRVRLHQYGTIMVSDGRVVRATLSDVPDQVLSRPAAAELTLDEIYSDPVLSSALTQGVAGSSLPLTLLLADDPLDPVLEGSQKPTLLTSAKADGQICHRVELERADGRLVFWIDQRTFVLRRLDYPTDDLERSIEQEFGPIRGLEVVAEFQGARLGGKIDEVAFKFEVPAGARLVEQFEIRQPPHPLLGKTIDDFQFTDLEGRPVTRGSLADKVVVIDFWATWCDWCFKGLPNLEQVYQQYKDNDRVQFLAVSTDEKSVENKALAEAFQKANLSLPIARDLEQAARDAFQVEGLPTAVILGNDGTVQAYEKGYKPQLATELPAKLDRLLAGGDLAQETIDQFQATTPVEVPKAEIAPASEPEKIRLDRLWLCDELKSPGNVLVLNDTDPARLLVHDGFRAVAEIDPSGMLVVTHDLDLPTEPQEAVVSLLRTATDGKGNRIFVGTASSQQQLHVFDSAWGPLFSYPPEGSHAGISDVQLADLDGDGEPEIHVGYWGVVGVQSLGLDGRRRWWVRRSLENVMRLAETAADREGRRQLLVVHVGGILPVDHQGLEGRPFSPGAHFVRMLFSADLDGDGQHELLAIATEGLGRDSLLGLDAAGQELWTYPLPPGVHPNPALEMATWGRLMGRDQAQWVVAGADGSIHIIESDGTLVDRFHYGVALNGLGVAEWNGRPALIVSSAKGVEALEVKDRPVE